MLQWVYRRMEKEEFGRVEKEGLARKVGKRGLKFSI